MDFYFGIHLASFLLFRVETGPFSRKLQRLFRRRSDTITWLALFNSNKYNIMSLLLNVGITVYILDMFLLWRLHESLLWEHTLHFSRCAVGLEILIKMRFANPRGWPVFKSCLNHSFSKPHTIRFVLLEYWETQRMRVSDGITRFLVWNCYFAIIVGLMNLTCLYMINIMIFQFIISIRSHFSIIFNFLFSILVQMYLH